MLWVQLPVLEVRLVGLAGPVRPGEHSVLCQAVGAAPPPTLVWTLTAPHGLTTNLTAGPAHLTARANLSTSTLNLTITEADHGAELDCTARVGPDIFPSVTTRQRLEVHHEPRVRAVGPARLIAGQDGELQCSVTARPAVSEVWWRRTGPGGAAGRAVGRGELLFLRNVSRADSGLYWCEAANSEGVGRSERLRLVVEFRPVCRAPAPSPHPPSHTAGVSLTCSVDSQPQARSYRWQYNSSQGSFEIPNAKEIMSFMNYAVSEEGGAGEVLCWASNPVGEQSTPCVFHVVPLGESSYPAPPQLAPLLPWTGLKMLESQIKAGKYSYKIIMEFGLSTISSPTQRLI